MNKYLIPQTDLEVSRIGYGCMLLGGSWDESPAGPSQVRHAIDLITTAWEQGINLFDHADIYARGKSEAVFGQALRELPELRDEIVIQSKCGIRFADEPYPGAPARYDFSYEHITRSVEGSLRRLQVDFLHILLLHRPDPLVQPQEVAKAFDDLQRAGKVRHFGVSNHAPAQIALLQRFVDQPLVINQVELNLLHSHLIGEGILANQEGGQHIGAAGILDYCRLHGILIQAWAPVAGGRLFTARLEDEPRVREAAALINRMATEKGATREAIMLAWLLRHPAGIQPIIGTTRPERIARSAAADEVVLSREEWYALFVAARGRELP